MKKKPLIELLEKSVIKELSHDNEIHMMELWEKSFCNISKSDKETIYLDQFKWHIFSYEKHPALEGDDAIGEYNKQIAREFYVIPEPPPYHQEKAFITNTLPDANLANELIDFYVFPKNLAWTMAFTHEYAWMGPYFAKHQNYDKLNAKNIKSVEAKESGW